MINFKNQSGRSMIEMLGVLAIIGVLSVGGIAGYSKAMMKYRINKTIEQITLIAGNVRTFFAPHGNYDGLNSRFDTGKAIIKKAKLVPDEMLTLDSDGKITNITNAFGGEIIIHEQSKISLDDDKAFRIGIGNIPLDACIELTVYDWRSANALGVMIETEDNDLDYKLPLSIEDATDLCSNMINNSILFDFDIDVNSSFWQSNLN